VGFDGPDSIVAKCHHVLHQQGGVVWMTGLSGSGKSTLAGALADRLLNEGHFPVVLDGDLVRKGLNSDLGFGPKDRQENIRRVAEVAALLADAAVVGIVALISPYRADRDKARETVGSLRFVEVFVDAPLEVCESRDPKGLYRQARTGRLQEFTGVSAPYEPPDRPELRLATHLLTVEQCVETLYEHLRARRLIRAGYAPSRRRVAHQRA
jgi:adenylylsulfate kinase